MGKLEEQIVSLLETSGSAFTLSEIALRVEKPQKTVFKALRKLFGKGKVDCENRRYELSKR